MTTATIEVLIELPEDEARSAKRVSSHLKSRFAHLRETESDTRAEERERFWMSLMKRADVGGEYRSESVHEPRPEECEARLRRNLGRHLKDHLRRELLRPQIGNEAWLPPQSDKAEPQKEQSWTLDPLSCIFFEVGRVDYGSCYFPLEIAGVERLAGLLDGNIDVLRMMLSAFLPMALEEALGMSIPAAAVDFYARPNAATLQSFQAYSARPPRSPVLRGSAWDRATWMWKVANFTLLPFALLAMVLCFMLLEAARDREAVAAAYMESIQKQQEQLLTSYEGRVQDLDDSVKFLTQTLFGGYGGSPKNGSLLTHDEVARKAANPATPDGSAPPLRGSADR